MSSRTRTIQESTVETTSGNSAAFEADSTDIGVSIDLTAISGTDPTISFSIEWSPDGANWGVGEDVAFTELTATAVVSRIFSVKAPFFRLAWVIGGTAGPSMTFLSVAVFHARGR